MVNLGIHLATTRGKHLWRVLHLLTLILLMAKKSGVHQLRLLVYCIIYKVYAFQVVQDFFHQQYQETYPIKHCSKGLVLHMALKFIFGWWRTESKTMNPPQKIEYFKASLINKSNKSLIFCWFQGFGQEASYHLTIDTTCCHCSPPPHRAPAVAKLSTGWVLEKDLSIFSSPDNFWEKSIRFPKAKSIHWSTLVLGWLGFRWDHSKSVIVDFQNMDGYLELRCPPEWRKNRKRPCCACFFGWKTSGVSKMMSWLTHPNSPTSYPRQPE